MTAPGPSPSQTGKPATTVAPAPPGTLGNPAPPIEEATTVVVAGVSYTCDDPAQREWECTSGAMTVYCSGGVVPGDCSELWYPDELASYDLVTFEGGSYLCDPSTSGCVTYRGGPLPSTAYPDVWCDTEGCSHYDPEEWFEASIDFTIYFCTSTLLSGFQQYDCYWSANGRPPSIVVGNPDAYCSGPQFSFDCSEDWYPDELDDYELVTFAGLTHVCKPAFGGSYGDYDCGQYSGGDPSYVYTGSLKCSNYFSGFECSRDYYPSELEGLYFVTIGYGDYVCEDTYQGSEYFSYWGGSPASATWGYPDYFCNSWGCDPDGYP